jgi:hypothetical protein
MADGDFFAPVSIEESAPVIQLMGEILDEVYQSPARRAAAQQAFANRPQGGGQPCAQNPPRHAGTTGSGGFRDDWGVSPVQDNRDYSVST